MLLCMSSRLPPGSALTVSRPRACRDGEAAALLPKQQAISSCSLSALALLMEALAPATPSQAACCGLPYEAGRCCKAEAHKQTATPGALTSPAASARSF